MDAEYDEFGNFIGELPPEGESDSLPGDVGDEAAGWAEEEDAAGDNGACIIRSIGSATTLLRMAPFPGRHDRRRARHPRW